MRTDARRTADHRRRTMKALRLHTPGDSNDLLYEDAPLPQLGPGDVLVEVHATAITFDEFQWPETYVDGNGNDRMPTIPAHEFSGVVAALGPDVTGFAVGEDVIGIPEFDRDGAAAQYVAVGHKNIAHRPVSLSHQAAASVRPSALTALEALTTQGRLRAGEQVLILGATGGVGSYAVQLARILGATVTAVVRTIHDGFAEQLGAHRIIQTRTKELRAALQEADLIIDTVGGTALQDATAHMHDGARLVPLGAPVDQSLIGDRPLEVAFFIVTPDGHRLGTIADMIDAGQLHPTVAAVYPLADGRRVYAEGPRHGRHGRTILAIGA
ncbi:NADP-dependent oxidoreductase [Arthrobacter burdickii]|uniref:NADP-dependent oxidoreductase n=1 Tax=Arthrobacter burdickii TaxID=3035920 RepID=A0ABT8K2J7_9MICC|nr:NADP-dependent oxidoreductase [Arthrobacter burdickii]MDN4611569.1 NADP-dependent oxidoreductase [Arthrobacter burdickii]